MRVIAIYKFWRDGKEVITKIETNNIENLEDFFVDFQKDIGWWKSCQMPDGTGPMEELLSVTAAIGPD